ncbi:unnamed protein product [Hymenolepis diminuta]|uniref:DUF4477 domain-containing protein n=1 Tax=Hymenolepis diminuta TaxID=6216 RepID=A0A0R3SFG4_HYMDI|nr:unnamed protein product [Hymenolepis diminuta]VUZ48389.1 unnamed protein product [Hymenolepis diminuta]
MGRSHEDKYHQKEILGAIDGLQRSGQATTKANIVYYVYRHHKILPSLTKNYLHRLHKLGYVFKILIEKSKCYLNAQTVCKDIQSVLNNPSFTTRELKEYSELFNAMTSEVAMRTFLHLINDRWENNVSKGIFLSEIEKAPKEVVTERNQRSDTNAVFLPSMDSFVNTSLEPLKKKLTNGILNLLLGERYQANTETVLANLGEKIPPSNSTVSCPAVSYDKSTMTCSNGYVSSSTESVEASKELPIVSHKELQASASFGQISVDASKSFLDELIQRTVKQSQKGIKSLCEVKKNVHFYMWLKKHL